jgi:hypothetical protein
MPSFGDFSRKYVNHSDPILFFAPGEPVKPTTTDLDAESEIGFALCTGEHIQNATSDKIGILILSEDNYLFIYTAYVSNF